MGWKYIKETLIGKQKLDKYNTNAYLDISLSNLTAQRHKTKKEHKIYKTMSKPHKENHFHFEGHKIHLQKLADGIIIQKETAITS